MHDAPQLLLTPADAVRMSGRSRDHIHKALNSGALKATQPYKHGSWQIDPEDLRVWIASGRPARPIPQSIDAADSRASVTVREGVISSCDAPRTGGGARPSSPPPPGVAVATRTHHGDATRAAS